LDESKKYLDDYSAEIPPLHNSHATAILLKASHLY
jgi:hypothetical protein